MRMNKFLSLVLALILCFTFVSCRDNATFESKCSNYDSIQLKPSDDNQITNEENTSSPLLYRVTDNEGHIIWLFGSIHVGQEDFYPLPDYVLTAFKNSDCLAVEADIIAFEKNLNKQIDALKCMIYTDGSSIKEHISEELYTKAVNILKDKNSYLSAIDMYYPVLWSSMIDSLLFKDIDADTDLGIDRYLIKEAYDSDKEIVEIESAEFQYNILSNFSPELQIFLLEQSIKSFENKDITREDLTNMMNLWKSGDEKKFTKYLAEDSQNLTDDELKLYNEYNESLIKNRNLTMTEYAQNALLSGKEVFICVGAAHVIGEGAMAQLLTQRGYNVELINSSEK